MGLRLAVNEGVKAFALNFSLLSHTSLSNEGVKVRVAQDCSMNRQALLTKKHPPTNLDISSVVLIVFLSFLFILCLSQSQFYIILQ